MDKIYNPCGQKLIIPTRDGFEFIEYDSILYGEAAGNSCKLKLEDRMIKVSKPLKSIESKLPSEQFMRVHQSFLVNIHTIVKYIKGNGGYVVLSDGTELKVAESKKREALQRLGVL